MTKYNWFYILAEVKKVKFEWDDKKDYLNRVKHGVSFFEAQKAFLDNNRVLLQRIWIIVKMRNVIIVLGK